jgi:multidrug resistance efflux pump
MEPLEPIPSPPGHHLREFCHRFLPVVVFVGAALATALLWNQRFAGTMLFGEVEPIRANLTVLEGGTLLHLEVARFQTVTNGQVIGTLQCLDPDTVRNELAVLRNELEVMRSRMALDEARNEQNVEGIRAQWLEARVDLATARVGLDNARRDLERARQLRDGRILSDADYDLALSLRDSLEVEVRERTAAVDGLAASLERLAALNQRDRGDTMDLVAQSLAAQERLLDQQRDVKLRAPMDGTVKVIHFRPGERVPAGAIVAEISAARAERIVGYVRQPLTLEPRPGMPVEIRTRGPQRQIALSRISGVGSDLELVVSPLRLRGFDNSTERGLAFFVDLPPELQVHPGELVDLVVRPGTEPQ